jgi:RNA 3'-phosphate cyclase
MVHIDGSLGEGGGQVLRSALSLALLTGQELEIDHIRARRKKPGLQPQHLAAVRAAAEVGKAQVSGAHPGSERLVFQPQSVQAGRFTWEIGTAGSAALVLQTVFVPLSLARSASSLAIGGGTHVPWSPCYHYLELHWLPWMRRVGFSAQLSLERAGFYPAGGGKISAQIQPAGPLQPLALCQRGALKQVRGLSAVANLDRRIAERQRNQVLRRIGARYPLNDLRLLELASPVKGTFLLLLAEFENSQACYFSLGAPGKPAERVADEAIDALEAFLSTNAAVDPFLADQLLLPLAWAGGFSQLRASQITPHILTNAAVIQAFLPIDIQISGDLAQPGTITIRK